MVCQQEIIGRPCTIYLNGLSITSYWQTSDALHIRATITALFKLWWQCAWPVWCYFQLPPGTSWPGLLVQVVFAFLTLFSSDQHQSAGREGGYNSMAPHTTYDNQQQSVVDRLPWGRTASRRSAVTVFFVLCIGKHPPLIQKTTQNQSKMTKLDFRVISSSFLDISQGGGWVSARVLHKIMSKKKTNGSTFYVQGGSFDWSRLKSSKCQITY